MCRRPLSADSSTLVSRVAGFGLAAWFFGNLYEGVVGMPQLLAWAQSERPPGLLASGSPVRYFAPLAPVALGASAVTALQDWRSGKDHRLVAVSVGCLAGAVALSAYLIRTVNLPLLGGEEALTGCQRRQLVARWHEINAVRLLLLAVASRAERSR